MIYVLSFHLTRLIQNTYDTTRYVPGSIKSSIEPFTITTYHNFSSISSSNQPEIKQKTECKVNNLDWTSTPLQCPDTLNPVLHAPRSFHLFFRYASGSHSAPSSSSSPPPRSSSPFSTRHLHPLYRRLFSGAAAPAKP